MMKKLTIFVDMDDTIEQLLKAWVIEANQRYGYSVSRDEVTDWDVTLAFPGLTMEQVYEIPTLPGFWKDVDPVPGAAEALQHFMAEGHDVYILSSVLSKSSFLHSVSTLIIPIIRNPQTVLQNGGFRIVTSCFDCKPGLS